MRPRHKAIEARTIGACGDGGSARDAKRHAWCGIAAPRMLANYICTRNAGAGYCVQDARVVMRSTLLNEHGQDGR